MKKILCILLLPVLLAATMTIVMPTVTVSSILPKSEKIRVGVGQTTQVEYIVTALAGGTEVTAEYGGDGQLRAPADEEPLTRYVCDTLQKMWPQWASDHPDIASVAEDGTITGLVSGQTVITLALQDTQTRMTCTVWVQVVQPITSLQLPQTLELGVGQQYALTTETLPQDAPEQPLEYTSSQPEVAAVNSAGVVSGLQNGEAVITATAPNDQIGAPVSTTITVTVTTLVEGIELNATQLSLTEGKSAQLEATVLPKDVSADYIVAWKSSDENVATVDENGRVSAVAPGTATITACIAGNEDVNADCIVTVLSAASGGADGAGGASGTDSPSSGSSGSSGDSAPGAGGSAGSAGGYSYNQAMQRELLALVNEARAAAGVPALSWSDSLEASCVVRAEELTQLFSHSRPDGSGCFTVNPLASGENIAAGYSSAQAVFEGWMNSEGHRNNILNSRWTIMGVGYVYSGNGGYGHYWCQLFG